MDTAAIYLHEHEIFNIRKLAEQETFSEELKYNLNFHVSYATCVFYTEEELTELMKLIPDKEPYLELRAYLQAAGNNIFRW